MSEQESKLPLLDDLPAPVDGDKFHHGVYASTLRDVLLSNRPGISVGLFGQWGYGKSTTVDQLEAALGGDATVVVFNAWKTRGDSLRKQLLLAILEKIDRDEADRYKEILGVPDVKKALERQEQARKKGTIKAFIEAVRDSWIDPVQKKTLQAIAIVATVLIVLMALLNWKLPNVYQIVESAILALAVSAVGISVAVLWKKYLTVIGVPEAMSESQVLQYPEHFRDAFERQIKRYCCEQKRRLVVVVDDLDRCEASSVVEALSAIRQFADQEKLLGKEAATKPGPGCQFLVPCDEQQVVLALEADGHYTKRNGDRYHNYETELLRKFFDVVIRMDQFLPDSLAAYAESEAKSIGLAPDAAREFIDLVNPVNPREVKKLLNSYRLARVTLARRQEQRLLPGNAGMPELERTLMVLVALREASPRAYDEVCKRPSLLHEYHDDEKKAQCPEALKAVSGILERAGRISQITAEYLIWGQYEPELMGRENGGAFALAFRRHDHDRFKELLTASNDDDRRALRTWILNRMGRESTVSRLRGDISMFVDYGHQGAAEQKFIAPCLDKTCNEHPSQINEVLDDFPRFDELRFVIEGTADGTKKAILDAVLANFLGDPDKRDRELGFLFSAIALLDDGGRKRFIQWLSKTAKDSKDADHDAFVQRVFNAAQPHKDQCVGIAPAVGVLLAQKQEWMDDPDEATKGAPEKWARSQLVTMLIGNDSRSAWSAIEAMFGPQGQLATPTQLHKPPPGAKPAWRAVGDLAKVIERDKATQLFIHARKWLTPQGETAGARVVLDAIAPVLPHIEPSDTQELGDYLAKLIWAKPGDLWLLDYIGKKPRGKEKVASWTSLADRTFQQLAGTMRSAAALNDPQKQILAKIGELGWEVADAADGLLGYKIQQLPPNGNTQQIEAWTSVLAPLLGESHGNSAEAVRNLLKNRQSISEALQAGADVLWAKDIDSDDATVIANMCVALGNQMSTHEPTLSRIMGAAGSGRIVEICVELLNDDLNWMKGRAALLAFVARHSSLADKAVQQKYQGKLKRMIISDDDSVVMQGMSALDHCSSIDQDVMKEVALRENSDNQQISELATSIKAKKILK